MTSRRRPVRAAVTALLAAACFVSTMACQPIKKDEGNGAAPPAAPEMANSLRASIQKSAPGSLVGIVILALSDSPYAAVGDIPVQDAKVGQTVTFIDGKGDPFNAGTVVAIVGDSIHVKFDTAGKRPPTKGDIAVILKE